MNEQQLWRETPVTSGPDAGMVRLECRFPPSSDANGLFPGGAKVELVVEQDDLAEAREYLLWMIEEQKGVGGGD